MSVAVDFPNAARRRALPAQRPDNIHCGVRMTWLGWTMIAASRKGVCAIFFGDEPEPLFDALRARWPEATCRPPDAAFARLADAVVDFIERPVARAPFPLDIRGTEFQRRTWDAMRAVPSGETASYSEIARRIGAPRAMRAVGAACGANPLAIVIPCHRILRANGDMSGYRWCVKRKRALLAREAAGRQSCGSVGGRPV